MKKIFIIISLISCLAQAQQQLGVEVLMGAQVRGNTIKIQVRSGGCTRKNSFGIEKYYNERTRAMQVTFIRMIPDFCEAYWPQGRVLTFTAQELRLNYNEKVYIGNPVLLD